MTKKQSAREEEYSPLSGGLFRILNKGIILLYSSLEGMHSPPKEFMHSGLRLGQARERLGLTYREVERELRAGRRIDTQD